MRQWVFLAEIPSLSSQVCIYPGLNEWSLLGTADLTTDVMVIFRFSFWVRPPKRGTVPILFVVWLLLPSIPQGVSPWLVWSEFVSNLRRIVELVEFLIRPARVQTQVRTLLLVLPRPILLWLRCSFGTLKHSLLQCCFYSHCFELSGATTKHCEKFFSVGFLEVEVSRLETQLHVDYSLKPSHFLFFTLLFNHEKRQASWISSSETVAINRPSWPHIKWSFSIGWSTWRSFSWHVKPTSNIWRAQASTSIF